MKVQIFISIVILASTAGAQVLPAQLDCQVDYQIVRARVFEAQCLKCHTGIESKAGVDLSSFSEAVKHLSKIESVVRNDEMPPTSSLTALEAELVLTWIAQGGVDVAEPEAACVN